jgi:hypothetical protein
LRGRVLAIGFLFGIAFAAARASADDAKLATRDEAAAAFLKGCLERVEAAPDLPKEKRQAVCEDTRDCVIEAMFTRDGKRKRPFNEIGKVFTPCMEGSLRKALGPKHGERWAGEPIRIEVLRPENDGLTNGVPAVVEIEGGTDVKNVTCAKMKKGSGRAEEDVGLKTVLLGGDRLICAGRVPAARVAVSTPRSMRPEGLSPSARSWDTTRMSPRFVEGHIARVLVLPRTRGSVAVGGWVLQAAPIE